LAEFSKQVSIKIFPINLSKMSYGSNIQQNPWDSEIPTLGKINDVLALADRKGYGNLVSNN
jgi:hypothetical protein